MAGKPMSVLCWQNGCMVGRLAGRMACWHSNWSRVWSSISLGYQRHHCHHHQRQDEAAVAVAKGKPEWILVGATDALPPPMQLLFLLLLWAHNCQCNKFSILLKHHSHYKCNVVVVAIAIAMAIAAEGYSRSSLAAWLFANQSATQLRRCSSAKG